MLSRVCLQFARRWGLKRSVNTVKIKRHTCIKIPTACVQVKISENIPAKICLNGPILLSIKKPTNAELQLQDERDPDKALDEMLELRSVATQRQHFFFQRIIKPHIMRARGVSPVIITRLYDVHRECLKARRLIRFCFNILLPF